MTNGNPLRVLQGKLAENAPDLIQFGLVGLKELVGMIQSLETPNKDGDDAESAEVKLQRFLRGDDVEQPALAAKGRLQ
jgi:hypothetical protein